MTFYDDITHAQKSMTTFQAESGSAQSTTMQSRRRTRGVLESGETESTFVLEPLSQRMARDMRGVRLDETKKGEDIV